MYALSGSSQVLAVYKKSVVEQGFFHEFAFDNKALKTSTNFESVENVQSSNVVEFEFELRHISSVTLKVLETRLTVTIVSKNA